MNLLLINHLIGFSLISVVLPSIAGWVYLSRPKHTLNQVFALYCMAIGWWAFFTIFMILATTEAQGLFWDRVCFSGVIFIPSALVHFIAAFTQDDKRLKKVIQFVYLISLIFFGTLWFTNLLISGVRPKFGMNYFTVPGALYILFIGFFISVVVFALLLLRGMIQNSTHPKIKKQATLLFWFSVIGYASGSCDYLLAYDVNLPGVAESANYGVLIFSLSLAYLIFRYGFLDIKIIIKRTLVFAGLFVMAMFSIVVLGALVQNLIGEYFQISPALSTAMGVVVAILFYDRTRKMLIHLTDRFLFQKKYDYRELLKNASKGMSLIQSADRLARLIVALITMQARIKHASLFVLSEDGKAFIQKSTRRVDHKHIQISVEHPMIRALCAEEKPIQSSHYFVEGLLKDSELIIPFFLGDGAHGIKKGKIALRGFFVLGQKKSDEDYTAEDLDVFYTLAQEAAIAIENARLYDEATKRSKELQLTNQELEENKAVLVEMKRRENLQRLAASIGHELNNPLAVFNMQCIKFSRDINKIEKAQEQAKLGRTEECSETLRPIIKDERELLEKFERFYERVRAVADTVDSLLKAGDRMAGVNLKMILDYSFEEVRFVTYSESLTETQIEFDVPNNLPPIRGNAFQLQAVFVNLIVNAYHALQGVQNRKIAILAELESDGRTVRIILTDNGCGMTKEVLDKCFDYRFTTKGDKGTGIGLTVCKQTIERHGGKLTVTSEVGKGTTFIIHLPVWDEKQEAQNYFNTEHTKKVA